MALVCKRLSALSVSPQLLQDVAITLEVDAAGVKAQQLLPWLARHASKILALKLTAQLAAGDPIPAGQWKALTASCLTAACAAGALQSLNLCGAWDISSWAWLPLAGSKLQWLAITLPAATQPAAIDIPLGHLSALTALQLLAPQVLVAPACTLPPALRFLAILNSAQAHPVPQQVRRCFTLQLYALTICRIG